MTIVIVGSGPCGLAAAYELERSGYKDYLLLPGPEVGGLSGSVTDRGFTWDHGGHVVFSHYDEFDRLLQELFAPDELLEHDRSSYAWLRGQWIPYPVQSNAHLLRPPLGDRVLADMLAAPGWDGRGSFERYMRMEMGDEFTELFMRPYNRKVWTVTPKELGTRWLGERVARVDKAALCARAAAGEAETHWGPNNRFLFPANGGTGEIWRRLLHRIPSRRRLPHRRVIGVDVRMRVLYCVAPNGQVTMQHYDKLISTMPLNDLVFMSRGVGAGVRHDALKLRSNQVLVVGVMLRRPVADDRSWLYFSEPAPPFYRATNFSRYSPRNARPGHGSWMCEIALEQGSPPASDEIDELARQTARGLASAGLLTPADVIGLHKHLIPQAYPIPMRHRDRALESIQPALEANEIYSRGRLGTWRYEYGNQDHAVAWGLDISRRLLHGETERQVAW